MKKRSPALWIALAVGLALLLLAGLIALLWTPSELYPGYYSAINSNRAQINDGEFLRDLYLAEDGTGRLSTCDVSGDSVDVIEFSSYLIKGNTVTFRNAKPYGDAEDRGFTQNADGTLSLAFSFSRKDGGFVIGSCHYERIDH